MAQYTQKGKTLFASLKRSENLPIAASSWKKIGPDTYRTRFWFSMDFALPCGLSFLGVKAVVLRYEPP